MFYLQRGLACLKLRMIFRWPSRHILYTMSPRFYLYMDGRLSGHWAAATLPLCIHVGHDPDPGPDSDPNPVLEWIGLDSKRQWDILQEASIPIEQSDPSELNLPHAPIWLIWAGQSFSCRVFVFGDRVIIIESLLSSGINRSQTSRIIEIVLRPLDR